MSSELIVANRFCGPAESGNGGWTAGALAAMTAHRETRDRCQPWPSIEVTLRQPPPLDAAMTVTQVLPEQPAYPRSHGGAEGAPVTVAAMGGVPIATAVAVEGDLPALEPALPAEAAAARAAYPGLGKHPFPTCFACGTGRDEGDGLRIFPGRIADAEDGSVRVASTWTPSPSVAEDFHAYDEETPRASLPVTWAALDCTGGWAGDLEERLMVLGRMTAQIDTLPAIGEEHVVVGQRLAVDGRKTFTASTLFDSDGRVIGRARHVWIAIERGDF